MFLSPHPTPELPTSGVSIRTQAPGEPGRCFHLYFQNWVLMSRNMAHFWLITDPGGEFAPGEGRVVLGGKVAACPECPLVPSQAGES